MKIGGRKTEAAVRGGYGCEEASPVGSDGDRFTENRVSSALSILSRVGAKVG